MAYQFDRIKILVAEDSKPLLEIMKSLLGTFGVGAIYTASDGEKAFELFCKYNPDIVIADWMMSPVDGIELCQKIRTERKSPNPYVPIILMTGYSERRRVFKARDAGITEFLVKPFNAQHLYKRIVQVIERPRQFIRSEDFFGPDRRRTSDNEYSGLKRRESDTGVTKESIIQAAQELENLRRRVGLDKHARFIINPDDEIDFT